MKTRTNKGRIEGTFNQDVNSDIQKVIELISKGFYLIENNTALEHAEGGYIKVSKRVTNYFDNLIELIVVSDCCGSEPIGNSKDIGICPSCIEHCEYIN